MTLIRLYLDEDAMRHSLAMALRASGVDVATPLSDDKIGLDDASQLAYATERGHVLYSYNIKDFARLHSDFLLTPGARQFGMMVRLENNRCFELPRPYKTKMSNIA